MVILQTGCRPTLKSLTKWLLKIAQENDLSGNLLVYGYYNLSDRDMMFLSLKITSLPF